MGHEREIVFFPECWLQRNLARQTAMHMPKRHPGLNLPGTYLSRGGLVLIGKGHRIGCLDSCETRRSAEGVKEV